MNTQLSRLLFLSFLLLSCSQKDPSEIKTNSISGVKYNSKQQELKRNLKHRDSLVLQLDTTYIDDQKYRAQVGPIIKKYGIDSEELKQLWILAKRTDSINLVKIRSMLDVYGWLGADIIGESGNKTLFLVIQHAPAEIREKYLPMMRNAVKDNRASARDLALLEDRTALDKGKNQIYGSQFGYNSKTGQYYLFPIADIDNLDQIRLKMGLDSIGLSLKRWNIKWDTEKERLKAESKK